jgi:hypothetical protein
MLLLPACVMLLPLDVLLLPASVMLLPVGMLLLPACFLLLPVGVLLLPACFLLCCLWVCCCCLLDSCCCLWACCCCLLVSCCCLWACCCCLLDSCCCLWACCCCLLISCCGLLACHFRPRVLWSCLLVPAVVAAAAVACSEHRPRLDGPAGPGCCWCSSLATSPLLRCPTSTPLPLSGSWVAAAAGPCFAVACGHSYMP